MQTKKLYVGCGKDRVDGYIHIDKRPLIGVDYVKDAWDIFPEIKGVDEIYSRHMLEHLTSMEADFTLRNWFKALKTGGRIHIIVPNMDYHCEQWLKAEWNEDALHDKWSDARHGFAGFYGWQKQCDPTKADYELSYWDVHKSGYNERRIRFLLERIGYDRVETSIVDNVHLVAVAYKSMDPGERQIAPTLAGIRKDHKARYELASVLIKPNSKVLDAACGVGYGSYILHQQAGAEVLGVDLCNEAIAYATKNYGSGNVQFLQCDLKDIQLEAQSFNYIVSFETYEHIDFTEQFINSCHKLLKEDGILILSTPNERFLPFNGNKFRFHLKHYLLEDIERQFTECGFVIEQIFSQNYYSGEDDKKGKIFEGTEGEFLIVIARKKSALST